jgi:hypothetical protein
MRARAKGGREIEEIKDPLLIYKSEQNNGNTKKLRNGICVGCIERTSVGNTECFSSVSVQSAVLV